MLTIEEKQELQSELNRIQKTYDVILDMTLCELFIDELKEVI